MPRELRFAVNDFACFVFEADEAFDVHVETVCRWVYGWVIEAVAVKRNVLYNQSVSGDMGTF